MNKAGLLTFIFCLIFVGIGKTQELGTLVFPSEDELVEALQLEEITYRQYIILKEIALQKVDSSNGYLLDEIPNLINLIHEERAKATRLEKDQKSGFTERKTNCKTRLEYKYYHKLNENDPGQYRIKGRVGFQNHWQGSFSIAREGNGRERILGRSITYRNRASVINKIILGSYSHRPGLGSVWGYRGKMVEFSESIDEESWLYPDYGGANGFLLSGRHKNFGIETLCSVNQDKDFRLISNGLFMDYKFKKIQNGLYLVSDRLKNRKTGAEWTVNKLAWFSKLKYKRGYAAFEIMVEKQEAIQWGGAVCEGRYRVDRAELIFCGWSYSDHFADINSGSKSGSLYFKQRQDETGFEYSSKRTGQEGGLFKSIVDLSGYFTLDNAFIYSGINSGNDYLQQLSGLSWQSKGDHRLRVDYLNKLKRQTSQNPEDDSRKTYRIEWRWEGDKITMRCFMAYKKLNQGLDYGAFFLYFKKAVGQVGQVELWSSFGRVYGNPIRLDYWYSFIKTEQEIAGYVNLGIKLANTYRKTSGSNTTASFEIEMLL